MDSLLVTPTSEADLQLLTALFKKMKIKAEVLPEAAPARLPNPDPALKSEGLSSFIPQNRGEENMLEALLEMQEILAGRKEAHSADDFLKELNELSR